MTNTEPKITVRSREELKLPLRTSPIRFAVVMRNGLTSHSWRVFTNGSDAYIACRETMKEVKVSLHASGRQHIAFTEGSGHEMTSGSRFWNRWWEPSSQQRPPLPSVKLLFPSWGTTLRLDADRPKWKDNHAIIEGDDELVTSVCLFVSVMAEPRRLAKTSPSNWIAEPHPWSSPAPHWQRASCYSL